jgi:acetoin utilization protein AcuB
MIARELINDSYPPLKLSDTGLRALSWMEEFRLVHIPVVEGIHYLGLVSEEDILKLDSMEQPLANQMLSLIKPYVKASQPVFEVVKMLSKDKLTLVPVVDDEKNYMGLITLNDVLKHYIESGIFEDAVGVIVLEMKPHDYSLSELARLVESEDARVLNSHITPDVQNETIDVTLKINLTDLSRIISSFTRHGYLVKEHYNQNEFMDDIKSRYDSLIKYLDI